MKQKITSDRTGLNTDRNGYNGSVNSAELTSSPQNQAPLPRMDARSVLQALEEMSQDLQPGDALPTQLELIRRFNASDRAVRWALDELRREGKIVSRRRVGTVVAERNPAQSNGYLLDAVSAASLASDSVVNSGTIVAICIPGETIFSRAVDVLFQQTQKMDLPMVCRLFDPKVSSVPADERPLGYLLLGRDLIPLGYRLQEAGHRVVLVGTPYADTVLGMPCAYGDQVHGGYLATHHLIELGHRHIVFRGESDWPQMRRWQGHQEALAEARKQGIEIEESNIFEDEYEKWRANPQLAAEYFRRPDAPTGIVAWSDQTAMSLLSMLSYVNVRVPHDVSLVGYDNLVEGQHVHPPLTTMDVSLDHQLRSAVRMITQASPLLTSQEVMVTSTLIRRASTAPPRS